MQHFDLELELAKIEDVEFIEHFEMETALSSRPRSKAEMNRLLVGGETAPYSPSNVWQKKGISNSTLTTARMNMMTAMIEIRTCSATAIISP